MHIYICIGITLAFIIWSTLTMLFRFRSGPQAAANIPVAGKDGKDQHPDPISSGIAARVFGNAVLLLILLVGYQFFANLPRTSDMNQKVLNMMIDRVENSSKQNTVYREDEETWDIFCTQRIAELYANYPKLQTKEFLVRANQIIGSKYIMTFDKNGDEVMSSNAYIGFQLGREMPSTKEFRYLLQGVDHIVHEPEQDLFSDNKVQLVGSRMAFTGDKEYGALIIAFNSLTTWESDEKQEITDYLTRQTPRNDLSMVADSRTNRVLYSSNPELINKKVKEIGQAGFDITVPSSLASFEIYGENYYGAFDLKEPYSYYYMQKIESTLNGIMVFPAFASITYFVIMMILAFVLRDPEAEDLSLQISGKESSGFSSDPAAEEIIFSDFRAEQMKHEAKVLYILRILMIAALLTAFILFFGPLGKGYPSFRFILDGKWQRGLNEMSLIAIITVICILIILLFLKNLLAKVLCRGADEKSETVIRLIASLVHYLAIISAIFVCLAYLGIDTKMLLASAGILTLAITLGSKDLVSGILAGIFIIFGGDFHVGDYVEINGFTGKVQEIGIRSTRLINREQNIKIIENQSIKNILNMSQELTYFSTKLIVRNDDQLDEIVKMLKEELPKIGKKKPEILYGPQYSGIKEIGYRRVTLSVKTQCRQEHCESLKKYVNNEIVELFHKHGFTL